jgi:hypothetical protein
MSEVPREDRAVKGAAPDPTGRRWLDTVLCLVCILGIVGFAVMLLMSALAKADREQVRRLRDPYVLKEQAQDDVAYIRLRDSARRHLAAVRTDARERPDEDLAHDIAVYAGIGKPFWREKGRDPIPALADLREAMDDLRPLAARRISCPVKESKPSPQCEAYMTALSHMFGRNL